MLTQDQIDRYLERLGMSERPSALDAETLDELIYRHQCSIPFETVSLHREDAVPSTDIDDLYDKVIERELGGYCFELNKLFQELLQSLGYEVRPVLCRAVRGRDVRMPINHRGMIVDIDGAAYVADVGFGGPMPAGALQLDTEGDQIVRGETFAMVPADNGWYRMERITRGALDSYDDAVEERRQVELEVCDAAAEEQDFDVLNTYFASPGTLFRDHEVVNLRTEDGYLGFKDGELTIRDNGKKDITNFDDPQQVSDALVEHFGLRLD